MLIKTNDDFDDVIFEKLLNIREDNGTWPEYYYDGVPCNTYYRPWESAVNLYAIDYYLRWKNKNDKVN